MKKIVFMAIAVVALFAITMCLDAQPAGGGMGGGMGGFGGGAGGGGFGGGMGMGGGRGARGLRARPDKAERLAAVKKLEKEVADLKAAVEKGPAKDPNIATLEGANLTKFMDTFTVESNAINTIQATLASLNGTGAGGGMMMGRNAGPTEEVLTELSTLAKDEKATKTAARIDALIQQAQQRATRGGGAGGGRGGAGGA